jgi:hypothetical protein
MPAKSFWLGANQGISGFPGIALYHGSRECLEWLKKYSTEARQRFCVGALLWPLRREGLLNREKTGARKLGTMNPRHRFIVPSLVLLKPVRAAYGVPNRPRYSSEVIKAFTISAFWKSPLKRFSLVSQN